MVEVKTVFSRTDLAKLLFTMAEFWKQLREEVLENEPEVTPLSSLSQAKDFETLCQNAGKYLSSSAEVLGIRDSSLYVTTEQLELNARYKERDYLVANLARIEREIEDLEEVVGIEK